MDVTGYAEPGHVDDKARGLLWFGLIIIFRYRHRSLVVITCRVPDMFKESV